MPHFTLEVSPSGSLLMDVFVGVSRPRREQLQASGQTVPPPVPVRALVDTGASITGVDPSIIQNLQIPSRSNGNIVTPASQAPISVPFYDVFLSIPHPGGTFKIFDPLNVSESNIQNQGIHVLVGRDILNQCLLVFDGQSGIFTLAF